MTDQYRHALPKFPDLPVRFGQMNSNGFPMYTFNNEQLSSLRKSTFEIPKMSSKDIMNLSQRNYHNLPPHKHMDARSYDATRIWAQMQQNELISKSQTDSPIDLSTKCKSEPRAHLKRAAVSKLEELLTDETEGDSYSVTDCTSHQDAPLDLSRKQTVPPPPLKRICTEENTSPPAVDRELDLMEVIDNPVQLVKLSDASKISVSAKFSSALAQVS